jgi:hypothetical protein
VTESELAASERFDLAGQHSDAINALARATKKHDLEAMTRLGERLLVGDRAPLLPQDGARFLVDAAHAGGARAAARVAVLAATGSHLKQSWQTAFDALVLAAERGWEPAQTQLILLAADAASQPFNARSQSPGARWRTLAATIDLPAWLSVPPPQDLHPQATVRSVAGLLRRDLCEWLIEQSRTRLAPARVYDAVSGSEKTHRTRSNTAAKFHLGDMGVLHVIVQARMGAVCGLPMVNMEAPAVLHYEVGEEIEDHVDFVDPRAPTYAMELAEKGQRVVTFLIYLNEDYAGGETAFPLLNVSYRGKAGDGLYFVNASADGAPDLRMVHAGRTPTQGEKWIVSQFIRSRAFR